MRFSLQAMICPKSPVVIGGSAETVGADRGYEVDCLGRPVIPASSFKGRVRATLESLARALGLNVCTPPRPDGLCRPNPFTADPLSQLCVACRVFGNPWLPAPVVCSDFVAKVVTSTDIRAAESDDFIRMVRTHVGISRQLGTAQEGRLYSTAIPGRFVGEGQVVYSGELSGELAEEDLGMLLIVMKSVAFIGGGKNHGLGAVTVNITTLQLEDEPPLSGDEAQSKGLVIAETALLGRR